MEQKKWGETVQVKWIPHHPVDVVFYDDFDQEVERVNVEGKRPSEVRDILTNRGFHHREEWNKRSQAHLPSIFSNTGTSEPYRRNGPLLNTFEKRARFEETRMMMRG